MSAGPSLPRRVLALVAVAVLPAVAIASCGSGDDDALQTLPPIFSTTTTLVPETTIDERIIFYEVKGGESLSRIADKFCVPRDELIRRYQERFPGKDPNAVPEGATIELPNPRIYVMTDCVPDATIPEL